MLCRRAPALRSNGQQAVGDANSGKRLTGRPGRGRPSVAARLEDSVTTSAHHAEGEHVVLRGAWHGRLWYAYPAIVVQDTSALIALYWRSGTEGKSLGRRIAPQDMLTTEKPNLIDTRWVNSVLALAMPGAAHAVWLMRAEDQKSFSGWYINLQSPLRRTSIGFDTMDYLLDACVSDDRSEWKWKDEDEFAEAETIGVFSAEEAHAIRREGQRAVDLVQDRQSPYSDDWKDWVPPPDWGIPTLRSGWDDIAMGDGTS